MSSWSTGCLGESLSSRSRCRSAKDGPPFLALPLPFCQRRGPFACGSAAGLPKTDASACGAAPPQVVPGDGARAAAAVEALGDGRLRRRPSAPGPGERGWGSRWAGEGVRGAGGNQGLSTCVWRGRAAREGAARECEAEEGGQPQFHPDPIPPPQGEEGAEAEEGGVAH